MNFSMDSRVFAACVTRSWLVTTISYRVSRWLQTIEYSGQADGMHGSTANVAPERRRPRMLSMAARYIQPADPVYQLQPPRPVCGATL